MPTTIAVKKETLEMLDSMKKELGADSFDKTIRKLVDYAKKPKKSYFGKFKNLGTFQREEIDRFD